MSPIARKLLRWYASRRRSLPWRENPRAYAVWVAEIMAQQTRLEAMLPYYRRWMRRFPSLRSLARSKEQDVLTQWEGLGYYSRARNLRRAAQIVMGQHGGRLPRTAEQLRSLPGIGRYTAGAIASLAFGADEAAVDGNAIRVLARLFDVKLPANSAAAQARFWKLAQENLPRGRAADYNQALMDLGASLCAARNPKCAACPLRAECLARKRGVQHQRPVRAVTKQPPVRRLHAFAILHRGKALVRQRPADGLLAGMWEFPNAPSKKNPTELRIQPGKVLGKFEHTYSHFSVTCTAHLATLSQSQRSLRPYRWVSLRQLVRLPMGKLDRRIANALRDAVR